MKIKTIVLIAATLFLAGCGPMVKVPATYKKPPRNAPSDDATIKLAQSANSVSDSLVELDKIQAAATPPVRDNLAEPYSYEMQIRASIDWAGPVEPLVRKIALASHYRVRVLGSEPAIPVLVNIAAKDEPLGSVLRNIDFQVRSNNKARVIIYSRTKTVELRYAKL